MVHESFHCRAPPIEGWVFWPGAVAGCDDASLPMRFSRA
jgi:hypothetical protein